MSHFISLHLIPLHCSYPFPSCTPQCQHSFLQAIFPLFSCWNLSFREINLSWLLSWNFNNLFYQLWYILSNWFLSICLSHFISASYSSPLLISLKFENFTWCHRKWSLLLYSKLYASVQVFPAQCNLHSPYCPAQVFLKAI